tara:strand:+ start:1680 stop:1877 length:198 start_codon:yes stop_codon:yes gene_type:complete
VTKKDEEKTPVELSIEIDKDGRVVLTDLPPELLELVRDLDPDAIIACDVPDSSSSKPKNETDDTD